MGIATATLQRVVYKVLFRSAVLLRLARATAAGRDSVRSVLKKRKTSSEIKEEKLPRRVSLVQSDGSAARSDAHVPSRL